MNLQLAVPLTLWTGIAELSFDKVTVGCYSLQHLKVNPCILEDYSQTLLDLLLMIIKKFGNFFFSY